jgi:DNA-binding transcriptional LysR family regulator
MNRGIADWRFLAASSKKFARPRVASRVNNGDMMRDAALAGLGIALLPTFIVGAELRSGALVAVDIERSVEKEFIYLAHPDGRRASAKLKELANCLRKAFGDPPYWEVKP